MAPLVVLVGPPGSGKTTVGTALAARLGVGLRDTDSDIEAATGREIADIFVVDGEPAFRRLEVEAVERALGEHDGVLALGGGAIESPRTRELLRSPSGVEGHVVVRLTVGATEAAKRVGIGGPRPLLLGNVRTRWSELMSRREPWYAEVADLTVATDGRAVPDVVAEIVAALSARVQATLPEAGG